MLSDRCIEEGGNVAVGQGYKPTPPPRVDVLKCSSQFYGKLIQKYLNY
jgi:hypothetical protein